MIYQFVLILNNEKEVNINFENIDKSLDDLKEMTSDDTEDFYGSLTISDNGISFQMEDSLFPIIQNLCFLAVKDILNHRHAAISYFSYYGYLRLDDENNRMLLTSPPAKAWEVLAYAQPNGSR